MYSVFNDVPPPTLSVSVPGLLVPALWLASVPRREGRGATLHAGLEDFAEQRLLPASGALLHPLPPPGPQVLGPWGAHCAGDPSTRVAAPPGVYH